MAIKVPIRTVYDNSNNAIGLSEFQSGDAVGYLHGGTGLTVLGSANQVLKMNDAGTAIEWSNEDALSVTGTPTGTFGSSSLIPVITVGADGRITNISNTSVASVSGFSWTSGNSTLTISTSAGSSFTAKIDDFDDLNNTGVSAGTYGSTSQVPIITVRADGRISSISNTTVAGVQSVTYNTSNGLFTINTSDGGSSSANITLQPFDTDNLAEGSTNLYFTTARARSSFTAGNGIDITDGIISEGAPSFPTGDYGNLSSDFQTLGDEINTNTYFDAQLPKGGLNTEDLGGLT